MREGAKASSGSLKQGSGGTALQKLAIARLFGSSIIKMNTFDGFKEVDKLMYY